MIRSRVLVGSLIALVGLGCGSGDDPQVQARDAPSGTRYRGSTTVLESPDHGPQLCRTLAESYPPQCAGPDVVGWDWAAVDDEEAANGTTWGSYEVTGTWDGESLTLTEPPGPPQPDVAEDPDFSSPCPEPPGGWAVVDRATTSRETLDAASEAARARPDFAGLWHDQPIRGSAAANDPANLVLNVRVSGDTAAAERDLRAIWGGALCVSAAESPLAELRAIQAEIGDTAHEIGMTSSDVDETTGVVEVEVAVDDGLQEEYDARYGAGTVAVSAWLEPLGR